MIKIKDAPYFKALCWALKKYTSHPSPDPMTRVNNIADDCNTMTTWLSAPDKYWSRAHSFFTNFFSGSQYFKKMIELYNKSEKNGQLEFDNLYPLFDLKIGSNVKAKENFGLIEKGYTGKVLYIYENGNPPILVLWDQPINGHNGNLEFKNYSGNMDFGNKCYCVNKGILELV